MDDTKRYPQELSREIARPAGGPAATPSRAVYTETIEVEAPESSDTHEFLEYWQILRRRKGAFVFIAFLGALSGFLVTLPQTPVYQARASLEITVPNENALNFKDAAATDSLFDFLDNYLQTQVRVMQSESVITRTLEKLKAENHPDFWGSPGRWSAWRKALRIPEAADAAGVEKPAALPSHSLQIRILPNTRIVDVVCDSTNPAFAAAFTNTLTQEYIQRSLETRSSGSERTKSWLANQLDDLKVQLEKSEEQLQEYSRTSNLIYTNEKDTVTGSELTNLLGQLSAARAERITKQSQYETVSSAPVESLAELIGGDVLDGYRAKLVEMKHDLLDLRATYTAAHPKVKQALAQIHDLESTMEQERKNALVRIRTDLEAAQLREKMLASAYASQSRRVSEDSRKAIQYNILKRDVDTNRELYESLLKTVKETDIASAMRVSNIHLIDQAKAPGGPYKPSMSTNIALGLLSGMFFGLVFIFVLEHADLSLKGPGDASLYLKMPELGVIPMSGSHGSKSGYGAYGGDNRISSVRPARDAEPVAEIVVPHIGLGGGEADRAELVVWQHKLSLVAESYRAALTSILLCGNNGDRPQTIVFTSAGPGEGKTTTVSNLGIALAEINRRVLIIDADMRKPRLHDVFNVPNTWGLSDLLREQGPIETLPEEALVRASGIPGLFVLPSGPATVSVSNLLYSSRIDELLRRFRREYYAVLIDTPPMMQIADARILAPLVDGVILVIGAGRTTRDAARAAKQRLTSDGIRLLGGILNRWDPKTASSYGVYGYYDGYYASYYKKSK